MRISTLLNGLLLLLIITPAAWTAAPASTTPATPDDLRARELVLGLGHPRFKNREESAKQLIEMGRKAKNALIEGKRSPDAEICSRCEQLLPMALALDLKARVDAFIADKEGKQNHQLPGLERFQKIAGNDAPARSLFVDILKNNATFLEECEENPAIAGEKYNNRAQELNFNLNLMARRGVQSMINAPDVAALFLVGSEPAAAKSIAALPPNFVGNFLWQQNFQTAIRSGDQAPAYRKLLFAWGDYQTDQNALAQIISIVQQNNLKEGVPFATHALQTKDMPSYTQAQAMTIIGKLGTKENATAFETLYTNNTVIGNIQVNNVMMTAYVGDVALAMTLHLSGLSPKEYGFESLTQPSLLWAYHYLGFANDEKRIATMLKAASHKDVPASAKAALVLALSQYVKDENITMLEPLLKDTTVVATPTLNGTKVNVELRDVALAVGTMITKQELADYGFTAPAKETAVKDRKAQDFYFASADKRDAAQKKWKEWVAKNPKKK